MHEKLPAAGTARRTGTHSCDPVPLGIFLETVVHRQPSCCRFIRAMHGALATLTQLLASANLSDVTEAISLLICCDKFCIAGSERALRRMLPLVFAREQGTGPPMHHDFCCVPFGW